MFTIKDIQLKDSFKNTTELYNSTGYFYQFGRYRADLKLKRYGNGRQKVALYSEYINDNLAVGLRQINTYMKSKEIQVEM